MRFKTGGVRGLRGEKGDGGTASLDDRKGLALTLILVGILMCCVCIVAKAGFVVLVCITFVEGTQS